ncbi:phosphatase PAP2 family protein [Actinomyces bowdenii]|uniref:phosphatase PAP2 family protein n=1 Tax=Actinomyces bowdenii TaxID=131109 RepID=UPI00214CEF93|nr:phosphatase PAP2 family protein [Actinomyces bowdenii]MCR2051363.1 phosphatase PAP2 family protein [Actinomyces bowdenii]
MISSRSGAPRRRRRLAVLLALACLAGVVILWAVFVLTYGGQYLDAAALEGSQIGSHYVSPHARPLLSVVSMPAAVTLVVVILIIGLLRRSHRRALWAVVAVVGANISTQLVKHWILWRPDYGITERFDNANTLPSGHTTMAASAAVALVLLAGPRWRAAAAWLGALGTVAMGYSTLVMQWHRPSDVLAAILLPVAWGAIAVAAGAWADDANPRVRAMRPRDDAAEPLPQPAAPGRLRRQQAWNRLLALAGALSCAGAAIAGVRVWQETGEGLYHWDYFTAYATGFMATAGLTCLALSALVSLTIWETGQVRGAREAGR